MADSYCSKRFKTGEELDEALGAALNAHSCAERAEAAASQCQSLVGSGLFVAEYGFTSYADIETAWNCGKTIVCHDGDMELQFRFVENGYFTFYCADISKYHNCWVRPDDYWGKKITNIPTNQRVTELETQMGDIEGALDNIIAIQEALIGGNA